MHLSRPRRATICFHPWLMHMYLSMKYMCQTIRPLDWSTSCHPLELLCLTFHWVALAGMNVKEKNIPLQAYYMRRKAWLMGCSGMTTVSGTLPRLLLFTATKTMTRMRFTYFSTRWLPLWWNLALISPDTHKELHTGADAQQKKKKRVAPPTRPTSHLKLYSITAFFYCNLAASTLVQKHSSFL